MSESKPTEAAASTSKKVGLLKEFRRRSSARFYVELINCTPSFIHWRAGPFSFNNVYEYLQQDLRRKDGHRRGMKIVSWAGF